MFSKAREAKSSFYIMFSTAGDSTSLFFIGFLKKTNDWSDKAGQLGDKAGQLGDKGNRDREAAIGFWKQPHEKACDLISCKRLSVD